MRLSILSRKLHRWGAIVIGLPVISVIGSGILLQVKKQVPWVQPHEQRTEQHAPSVDWGLILAAAKGVPDAGVTSWADIDRVDVRPGKGILKIVTNSRWEVQMALATGEVLQVAYRRSDLIESLHDGSFYGDRTKLAIFLPSGIVLFGLWLTGLYLWLLPYLTKRKRAKLQEKGSPAPGARA
jgi:hypothetical protein